MSRRPVILGATVVAAALLASLAAATEARASHQGTPHKLVVRTIPAFKGVPVKLNKKKKNTGRRGLAILTHSGDKKLKKRLTVADAQPAEHVRSRFARWYGDPNRQNVSKLTAALDVDYLVGFNFIDRDGEPIDAAEISRMVLRSSVGNILEFEGEALQSQHWLHGTRVVSRREGPFAKEILYSVEQVIVNGSNVVNRAQQRFVPEEARDFAITLLYFTATFTATDALFGHTTGSGIRLERPDGVVEEHAFNDGGTLVLAGLPRGEYIVSVIGPGPAFERPVTVTRDQDVELDVLSWLDLGITALVLAIAVIGLLLIGRPHLLRLPSAARAPQLRPRGAAAAATLLVGVIALFLFAGPAAGANEDRKPADQATVPATTTPYPILAYYYIWFNPTSWSRAKSDYPILGRYSSDEERVMRRHVRWAKAAGIDGFLVSWKATSSLNQRLNKLARLAAEEDFKLGIVYQALDFEREPLSIRRIRADLDFFIERYADDPVFDIFEKPVVIWTGTEQFRRKQIARTVAPRQDDLLVLASEKNVEGIERLGKAVQGNAYYWSSVDPQSYMSFSDKLVAMGEAVHDLGGLWIAPAAPGFDARLVGGTSVVERRSGDTFRARLDGATRSAPDALGVISWNEFSENTHIEPSELYGQRYLEILADVGGATFDIEAVIDSSEAAGDERSATGVGYGAPLLGGVLALGVIAIVGATWRSRKAVTKESTRGNGESTPYSGEPRGEAS